MACDVKTSGKADSEDARGAYILKRLMTEQMKEGYIMTPAQACGVVGNFYAESRYDPGAVGDHGNSHGIMQWNDGAGWGFIDYFTKKGIPWKDLKNQVDFFLTGDNESMVKERKEWIKWCKENPKASPGASANRFCVAHERPKNKESKAKEREKYADKWADWLKSNSVGDCDFSTLNEASKTESDTPSGGENSQQESVNCGNNAQQSQAQTATNESISDFTSSASTESTSGGSGAPERVPYANKNMYLVFMVEKNNMVYNLVDTKTLSKKTNLIENQRCWTSNSSAVLGSYIQSANSKRGNKPMTIYVVCAFHIEKHFTRPERIGPNSVVVPDYNKMERALNMLIGAFMVGKIQMLTLDYKIDAKSTMVNGSSLSPMDIKVIKESYKRTIKKIKPMFSIDYINLQTSTSKSQRTNSVIKCWDKTNS